MEEQMGLGEVVATRNAPLADRMRPRTLDEVIGQEHLTGPEGAIGRMVAAGKLSSMVLWGPPGTGKSTTIFHIITTLPVKTMLGTK